MADPQRRSYQGLVQRMAIGRQKNANHENVSQAENPDLAVELASGRDHSYSSPHSKSPHFSTSPALRVARHDDTLRNWAHAVIVRGLASHAEIDRGLRFDTSRRVGIETRSALVSWTLLQRPTVLQSSPMFAGLGVKPLLMSQSPHDRLAV